MTNETADRGSHQQLASIAALIDNGWKAHFHNSLEPFVFVPGFPKPVSLQHLSTEPLPYIAETRHFAQVPSLIDYAGQYIAEGSKYYLEVERLDIENFCFNAMAVLDYHIDEKTPDMCKHVVKLNVQRTRRLRKWMNFHERTWGQGDIVRALIPLLDDVFMDDKGSVSSSELMGVLRNLSATSKKEVSQVVNEHGSAVKVQFAAENAPDIKVPDRISIEIPMLEGDTTGVRLELLMTVTQDDHKIQITTSFTNLDMAMEVTWQRAYDQLAETTAYPPFITQSNRSPQVGDTEYP